MAKNKDDVPDTLDGPRARYHTMCCAGCKHRLNRQSCAAFPDGKPDDIFFDRVNHREPYPGDGGIQWEKDDRPVAALSPETLRRIRESGI